MRVLLPSLLLPPLLFFAAAEEILIIGGEYSSWSLQVYDPSAAVKNNREHIRLNHVGVLLPNSSIFIMGGRDMMTKSRLRSTAILNLAGGSAVFRSGPDMLDVRSGAAAVTLGGEVVVCGGVEGVGPRCPLSTCERLVDGRRWERMEPMLKTRGGLALAVVAEKMYAFGGESWDGDCNNKELYRLWDTSEKYDPKTKKWAMVASMKKKRFLHTSAVYKDKVYVCGGQDGGSEIYNDCEIYNPASDSWVAGPTMNRPRFGFGLVVLGDKLYAIGGSSIPYSKREYHDDDTTLYSVEWVSEGGAWVRRTCGLLAQTYAPSVTVISDAEYRTLEQIAASPLRSTAPATLLPSLLLLLPLLSL